MTRRLESIGIEVPNLDAQLKLRKLEVTQVKKQIEILLTFLPDEILHLKKSESSQMHHFVGVLLFADVSGFTPLCEKYNKTGKGGIYRLTATLNAYIGAIVEVIYFFGGDVLKFSGDAFLALWKADLNVCLFEVIHQVIVCALSIQSLLGHFETEVNVLLKVKLAIACGNMTFSVIGDDEFKHYVILGEAINDVKAAEHASVSGDVMVAPCAWGHLAEESYEYTHAEGGNIKIWKCVYKSGEKHKKEEFFRKYCKVRELCQKHLDLRNTLNARSKRLDDNMTDSKVVELFIQSLPPRASAKVALQKWIASELNPFVIKPVKDQVEERQPLQYLTEMREVTIQFINIVPIVSKGKNLVMMVDNAYRIICKIVSNVLGVVNKASLFDKDAMLLVLFGLKGVKHELESQNALKSAHQIRSCVSKLDGVKSVSVGITNGLVYCGVVGHPLRKEYTVIGGAVNKAARIMCAYKHKVTCDHQTYKNSKLPSTYFQLQLPQKLKGIENPGHIFEYNENFQEGFTSHQDKSPLIGRQDELDYIYQNILEPGAERDGTAGVCIKGKAKSGKTYIMEAAMSHCKSEGFDIASVVLFAASKRPFFCAHAVYRQLYDLRMSRQSEASESNLERDLWDLNDILQSRSTLDSTQSVNGRETASNLFIKLCKSGGKQPVVFIDNAQYIDHRSFSVIERSLQMGVVKLVCAGNFEEDSWDTLWKFSLNNQIKILELEPLDAQFVPLLVCQFLKVHGVTGKLCTLIENTCEGRPGWIQSCLLKLVNNNGIKMEFVKVTEDVINEYVFPTSDVLNANGMVTAVVIGSIVPVVTWTKQISEADEEFSLAAISLDLFDSFTPYEQLIIKTGSILGDIFTRTLLTILLKYPKVPVLTKAVAHLFEEEVFDCGSKYITHGGAYSREITCACFGSEDETELLNQFPKYGLCKLLHFKNKTLRAVAYELIPANQRKELHLKITDVIENQNNSCPSCLRDKSASLFRLDRFGEMYGYFYEGKDRRDLDDNKVDGEDVKRIIRSFIVIEEDSELGIEESSSGDVIIPKRKLWDPSVCFCLEIFTRVYSDLIYHSEQGEHLAKRVFYLYVNGVILCLLGEEEDSIVFLKETTEFCSSCIGDNEANIIGTNVNFFKLIFAKANTLLAECYYRLNNFEAAKNYAHLALRQHGIPFVAFHYRTPFLVALKKMTVTYKCKKANSYFLEQMRDCAGKCLTIVSRIFYKEGHGEFAKIAADGAINLIKSINPNIRILCDIYSSVLDFYNYGVDAHLCEQLQRCIGREMMRLYAYNLTSEFYGVAKLMTVLFQIRAKSGELVKAVRLGFRAFDVNQTIHAYLYQTEVIPVLAYLLLQAKRLEEAVQMVRVLRNVGKKYDRSGDVPYYTFCVVLILETGFYLEPIHRIEEFARDYFQIHDGGSYSYMERCLTLHLYNYFLREGSTDKASFWKRYFNPILVNQVTMFTVLNSIKYLECLLLNKFNEVGVTNEDLTTPTGRILFNLNECQTQANLWNIFHPRVHHYSAYFYQLTGQSNASRHCLQIAHKCAIKNGNLLEQAWLNLSESCWNKHYGYGMEDTQHIPWQMARNYNILQWSQIMYPLPIW